MQGVVCVRASVAEVFDFFARPANMIELTPPELDLQLIEGPERLALGAMLRWKARRMGVSQTLIHEVTAFEDGVRIEHTQRQGPFRRWVFAHRLAPADGGARLTEELSYEPPGGMLGLLVGAESVRRDLERLFAYRGDRLRDRFGSV